MEKETPEQLKQRLYEMEQAVLGEPDKERKMYEDEWMCQAFISNRHAKGHLQVERGFPEAVQLFSHFLEKKVKISK